jgi:hypothetical protein
MTYTSNDKLVNPTSNQPAHLQSVSPNSSTKWFIISLEDSPVDRYIHWQVSMRIGSEMIAHFLSISPQTPILICRRVF